VSRLLKSLDRLWCSTKWFDDLTFKSELWAKTGGRNLFELIFELILNKK